MKSRYLIGVIILLGIINLLLLHKNYILREQIKKEIDVLINPSLQIEWIPNFELYDLNMVRYNSEEISRNSPYTLLVFFSPIDCAPCLEEKDLWKRISEEGKVKIVGIGRHIDMKELRDWVENSEIFFPVLYDIESKVTKKFGISKTPLKILINNKGKIILIDRVRITSSEQEEFIEILYEITKN
ncbi:MAG TPA: TlpA disulfide reductase family protein [Acidobacteriota bacterium]|nr:TlpA disulfide reductase family protein [Acidobacteriota bacterium]